MARIYDKGRESKSQLMQQCVRYEIEFKRARAAQVAALVFASSHEPGEVCGLVSRFVTDRGCVLPKDFAPGKLTVVHRGASDCAKKLAWLQTSVAPTLLALNRAGLLQQALESLGLSEVVTPNDKLRVHQSRSRTNYVS